jgi:hypothetical protein
MLKAGVQSAGSENPFESESVINPVQKYADWIEEALKIDEEGAARIDAKTPPPASE